MDKETRLNESMMMLDQFAEAFHRTVSLIGRVAEDLDEITQKLDCLNDIYDRVTNCWEAEDEKDEDETKAAL